MGRSGVGALQERSTREAAQAMDKALALHTNDPLLLFHAGMICHALGQTSNAEAFLGRALKLESAFRHCPRRNRKSDIGRHCTSAYLDPEVTQMKYGTYRPRFKSSLVLLCLILSSLAAFAHPMGNFSINHYSKIPRRPGIRRNLIYRGYGGDSDLPGNSTV